uniref:Uncharacterized protein n=1 Tax=Amphiprion percula TaxID=161767 RepID=A0A3P8TQL5_AMPPE
MHVLLHTDLKQANSQIITYFTFCILNSLTLLCRNLGAAFTHSIRHSGTRRINHGDEAQEAELLGGEVHVVAVEVAEACKRGGIS